MRRLAASLGLAGVLGIGVLLFCASFYASTLLPAQRELAARQRGGGRRQRRHATRSPFADPLAELHSTPFPARSSR